MSVGTKKRNEVQKLADQDYLLKLMNENPEFTAVDYHILLNEHIKDREKENAYDLSYAMVARIAASIKQGYVKHAGLNIQQEVLDTNERYEYLISIAADELSKRLLDRQKTITTITDLDYGDISHLNEAQRAVLATIELEVTKKKQVIEDIPGGTGIETMIAELDKLLKSKRGLLGLDAPKKIEKSVLNKHVFQNVDRNKMIELFEKLHLPTEPLQTYFEATFKKKKIGEEIKPEADERE